jgi:hypothetical protein
MKVRLLAFLLAAFTAGCSSDVYPASDILVEGTSTQAAVEYIYFRVPDGTECTGVRIRSDATQRVLSFVRSTSEVDSVAVVSEDYMFEGALRVEVPIDETVLKTGGEMTIVIEGGGESKRLGTFGYPADTQSNQPMQPDGAAPHR